MPDTYIKLTQNQFAIVDLEDYEWLGKWKWYAKWSKCTSSFYAARNGLSMDGKRITILMHREILGLSRGDPREGDHAEVGKTLDNRRRNLRIATESQNRRNTLRKTNTSGFKGVIYHKPTNKWKAMITVDGAKIYLGLYGTKEEAYAAYCVAAIKYHGEFARVA